MTESVAGPLAAARCIECDLIGPAACHEHGTQKYDAAAENAVSVDRAISEVSVPLATVISTPCPHCGKTPLEGIS